MGTCSAYFRTRSALQGAVAQYLTGVLLEDVEQLAVQLGDCGEDHGAAVGLVVDLFEVWLDQRSRLVSRLELTLEAGRDPAIAELMLRGRHRLEDVVAEALQHAATVDKAPTAVTLVAALDGVLLAASWQEPEVRADFLRSSIAELVGPPPA